MIHWRRFFSRKQNILALAIIGLFFFVAAAAPRLAPPDDPEEPLPFKPVGRAFDRTPHPPNELNLLGTTPRRTDVNLPGVAPGQASAPQLDIYYTLIWGTRSALRFGLTATLLTATFGTLVGLASGYAGGLVNGLLMRMTDAFLTFPPIAAVWLFERALFSQFIVNPFEPPPDPRPIQLFLESLQLTPVMLALVLFSWMPYARIINALVLQLKKSDFVLAAQSMGASGPRIIFRHLLPNAISPAVVLAARDVGGLVILESAFTFIGLGGTVAWGVLLVGGRDYIIGLGGNPFTYWWTFLPVAMALILFGIGWNLLGDGLNTLLNPRAARRR
ncbi:MAG: ABC transporter permease [Chloroflexi bacterium]|nr:ABC transporter permease [Chloroflexota bacterium]MCI0648777.1 ABC transporter permease [Chloroflexota bacterium]MCI0727245.1 ABC transporter permease [Chloroflexota bacterium]